jgi:hypothetical protein
MPKTPTGVEPLGVGGLCGIMHDTSSVKDRRGGLKVSGYTRQMTKGPNNNNPLQEMQNTRFHKQPWFCGILGTSYAMGGILTHG